VDSRHHRHLCGRGHQPSGNRTPAPRYSDIGEFFPSPSASAIARPPAASSLPGGAQSRLRIRNAAWPSAGSIIPARWRAVKAAYTQCRLAVRRRLTTLSRIRGPP